MLSDRYSTSPPGGLLVYLKANHMQGLPSLPHEKRGMICVIYVYMYERGMICVHNSMKEV